MTTLFSLEIDMSASFVTVNRLYCLGHIQLEFRLVVPVFVVLMFQSKSIVMKKYQFLNEMYLDTVTYLRYF